MKKVIIMISLLMSVLFTNYLKTYAEEKVYEKPNIKIVIDTKKVNLTGTPIITKEKTLLPLRTILSSLGVPDQHIIWNETDKSILIVKDNKNIKLKIGSNIAYVNDGTIKLDVEPFIYKNKAYIPVRFISQSFGKKVVWESASNTIIISDENSFNEVKAIWDKANALMGSSNYKMTGTIDMVIKNIISKTTSTDELDNINKVSHYVDTQIITNLQTNEISATSEEIYYIYGIKYSKKDTSEPWQKEVMSNKEINNKFGGSNNLNVDAIYAGLKVVNPERNDEIMLEGDIDFEGLTEDYKDGESYKTHTRIVINKYNYFVKSLTFKRSGKALIGDTIVPYSMKSEYKNYELDYKIKIPSELN